MPLRRQALRQRHPRVHRVRGGPRPESARDLPKKGRRQKRRERRRRSRVFSAGAAGAAGRPLGVKADAGLAPFEGPGALQGDTVTRGLERLPEACARWKAGGASFTKWRSALEIRGSRHDSGSSSPGPGPSSPSSFGASPAAVAANAEQLARYAAISQAQGWSR